VRTYYVPCGVLGGRLYANGFAGVRSLADWEGRVREAWPQVGLKAQGPARGDLYVGQALPVRASLHPAQLRPDDLAVELVYGHARDGELLDAVTLPMISSPGAGTAGQVDFGVDFASPDSGLFAYGVRVRPQHPDLPNPYALHLACWA
jgi:starch phosphorylase